MIDHCFHIPYLGGISKDGKTVYIDKNLPRQIKIGNRMVDVSPFLAIHERTEWRAMQAGHKYADAHEKFATPAERRAVEGAGINWQQYQDALKPYIHKDEHGKPGDEPKDLDTQPYIDSHDARLVAQVLRKR